MKSGLIPPQITRLILLTIGIVGAYLIARALLTPPSFGQYGWYRGEALHEAAQREPRFAGKTACVECHEEEVEKLSKAEHKTLSCETCHGPSSKHASDPDEAVAKPEGNFCVRCHEASPSRPEWLKQINPADHYSDQKCLECHLPHQPTEVP